MNSRIEIVIKDNSHSWVRISHGLNELVTDVNKDQDDNEQEISETKTETFALKTDVKVQAKPRRPSIFRSSTKIVPIRERMYNDIGGTKWQKDQTFFFGTENSLREQDGAIEFWRFER